MQDLTRHGPKAQRIVSLQFYSVFATHNEGVLYVSKGVFGAYWKRLGRLGGDLGRLGGVLGAFLGRLDAINSVLRAS